MDIIWWIVISLLFLVAFVGLVYPIIPSVIFIFGGFFLYGFAFSFEPFGVLFWLIQVLLFILLLGADTLSNLVGVKKFGGTKAGMWGSTIGLLVGPFIIPVFGILIGPFVGAVVAELVTHKRPIPEAIKVGIGSLVGFLTSVVTKGIIQLIMIGYFLFVVLV